MPARRPRPSNPLEADRSAERDGALMYLGIDIGTSAVKAVVVTEGALERLRKERYGGWAGDLGRQIESGKLTLAGLADLAAEKGFDPAPRSGRQELAESLIARHCKY